MKCFPSFFLPLPLAFSIFLCRSHSKACLHIDPSQFRDDIVVSPIRSIAFSKKREKRAFSATRLHRLRDRPVVFPRLSSWPVANFTDFPASRNGQLRRSSLGGIKLSVEWLLPRSLFNKFPCEKSLSSDCPTVYLRNV